MKCPRCYGRIYVESSDEGVEDGECTTCGLRSQYRGKDVEYYQGVRRNEFDEMIVPWVAQVVPGPKVVVNPINTLAEINNRLNDRIRYLESFKSVWDKFVCVSKVKLVNIKESFLSWALSWIKH